MSEHPGTAGEAATAPPVCPRHPDRVSYVRCQRCGRPTCPQCQVPAAVGIQCVDCVREQRRTAPAARTAVGATVRDGRPTVTYGVLGLLVVLFVGQLALAEVSSRLIFVPALSRAEPWRFLTGALIHDPGFIGHILLNGLVLWRLGPEIEARLGTWRYVTVLALCAVGGNAAVLWLTPLSGWYGGTLGFSGAIFGLFGLLVALQFRGGGLPGRQWNTVLFVVVIGIVLPLALNTLQLGAQLGIGIPLISWEGHLGGLVVGAAAGAVLVAAPRRNRAAWQGAGLVGIAVLLVLLIIVRWAVGAEALV